MSDRVEFLHRSGAPLECVESSMRFAEGDLVSIQGTTYCVVRTTFALDYSDMPLSHRLMRQDVYLEKRP